MPDIRIDGNVALAQFALARFPRIEVNIEQLAEDRRVAHALFRHLAPIADGNCSNDIRSRRARGFHHLLDGAAGRRQIFDDERLLALDDLVVSAFDDESSLPVFVSIHAVDLAARELAEMVRGPLRENCRPYRGADDGLHTRVFEPLRHRASYLRRLARVRVHRVFQNIRAGVPARREDEMSRAKCADFLEEFKHFVFVHIGTFYNAFVIAPWRAVAFSRAASAKLGPLEANMTARDAAIIIPLPRPSFPAFTVFSRSPLWAPIPGIRMGISPTILRTSASSSGDVAPTTSAQFPFSFHFSATWRATVL